jgi:hypothetical protein
MTLASHAPPTVCSAADGTTPENPVKYGVFRGSGPMVYHPPGSIYAPPAHAIGTACPHVCPDTIGTDIETEPTGGKSVSPHGRP